MTFFHGPIVLHYIAQCFISDVPVNDEVKCKFDGNNLQLQGSEATPQSPPLLPVLAPL